MPDYAEYGDMIRSGGKQLLGIVNDLLLAAEFQSNEVSLSPRSFGLEEVATVALTRVSQRQSWVSPVVDIQPSAMKLNADFNLFTTALVHLLDNVSKFAGKDAVVTISELEDGSGFAVEDNGPGFEGEDTNSLAALFHQVDGSKNRRHEGCGMGLFLTKSIANVHGGNIKIQSRKGEGFRVEVEVKSVIAHETVDQCAA